jgi:hypothetical protein
METPSGQGHDIMEGHPGLARCSNGGVVEWLMAPVLKTGVPKGTVGSNPTPSVFQPIRP